MTMHLHPPHFLYHVCYMNTVLLVEIVRFNLNNLT